MFLKATGKDPPTSIARTSMRSARRSPARAPQLGRWRSFRQLQGRPDARGYLECRRGLQDIGWPWSCAASFGDDPPDADSSARMARPCPDRRAEVPLFHPAEPAASEDLLLHAHSPERAAVEPRQVRGSYNHRVQPRAGADRGCRGGVARREEDLYANNHPPRNRWPTPRRSASSDRSSAAPGRPAEAPGSEGPSDSPAYSFR